MTYVYFAGGVGTLIKIGCSVDPVRRVRRLRCPSTHERVSVLAMVPGTFADEVALHDSFASDCVWGEWFSTTPRVTAALAAAKCGAAVADLISPSREPGAYDRLVRGPRSLRAHARARLRDSGARATMTVFGRQLDARAAKQLRDDISAWLLLEAT